MLNHCMPPVPYWETVSYSPTRLRLTSSLTFTYHVSMMDGDPRLSCRRFHVFWSSVAASACMRLSLFLVVVVARVAHECAHEFALVAETGVAVCAQSKLEFGALLVALFFREIHEGHMRGLLLCVVGVVVVLGFKHRFVSRCN